MQQVKRIFPAFLCLAMLAALSGCFEKDTKKNSSTEKKFSIYFMTKDGQEYIVETNSLSAGVINPKKQGTRVDIKYLWSSLIVRDGHYYYLDNKSETFLKSRIENNVLVRESSLKLKGFAFLENYNWINPDTLFLITYNRNMSRPYYARVSVKDMTAKTLPLDIPPPSGIFNWMSIGFSEFRDKKLFIGYTYHTIGKHDNFKTSDTTHLSVLSYPGMRSKQVFKDTRSTYPGGINTEQPFTFTDERGDFYFIACPGIALGNNPGKPTGIFRIRSHKENPDPDYFFNISASTIQNHAYGMWYIGNGKALVRSERKELFTGMKDHYKVPHFSFYVLDIAKKSTTRLELPLDKGSARQCVIIEKGLAYISINSDSEGSNIWIYDPKRNSLRMGLKFEGDIDYVLRMDRLH